MDHQRVVERNTLNIFKSQCHQEKHAFTIRAIIKNISKWVIKLLGHAITTVSNCSGPVPPSVSHLSNKLYFLIAAHVFGTY